MKLAEALLLRKDLQNRLSVMEGRLHNSAQVQEGEQPPEDPQELLAELDALTEELEQLYTRINLTNAQALDQDESLTALLARRDLWQAKLRLLRDFLYQASSLAGRVTRTEIKLYSTVDVRALRQDIDGQAKALRELDARIQGLNWTVDLL